MASNIQLFETALAHHTAGRLQEAEALYRQILEGDPNHGEAWHLLGVITLQAGNREQAMKLIGQAIAIDPQRGAFHHNLGMALELSDRSEEAIACYRKALSLEPTAASWHGLGRILRKRGEIEEAIQCYRNFLQLEPNSIDALFELGLLFQGVGLADEAFSAYHRCTQLKPDHTAAFNNMASLMRSGGKIREALALYQQAVNIEPDYAVAHANLGILYKDFYELEAAIQHLEKAVQLNPSMVEGHSNLGDTYAIIGDLDRAQTCYEQALALAPHDGLRLKLATRLPAIYPSTEEIEQWRSRFTQGIEALKGQPLSITDPTLEVGSTSFFLAYQGQDDRPVQQSLGKLYRSLNIWTHRTHRPNDKPRIGFISRFLSREHTIGRLYMGIADHLDRERFDVVVFTIAAQEKPNIHGSHTWVNLPDTGLPRIREEIARHNLDLLLYTDLGMDPATYFTAFNRLAPVQCTTWGHPVTSGIDTVDYFISSRLYEDESNQGHYTERLVLMDSTNTYYYRPTLMENPPGREDFGFAPTDHLYLCPQTLFKFHPDFDPILADILRQDPQGILVLVSGPVAQWGKPCWTGLTRLCLT